MFAEKVQNCIRRKKNNLFIEQTLMNDIKFKSDESSAILLSLESSRISSKS